MGSFKNIKEFLYDIQREKNPDEIEQLITKYITQSDQPELKLNTYLPLQDFVGDYWIKYEVNGSCTDLFCRTYTFTDIQIGYIFYNNSCKVKPIKYKILEIFGNLHDGKEIVSTYKIANRQYFYFDENENFLKKYIIQRYNKKIQLAIDKKQEFIDENKTRKR